MSDYKPTYENYYGLDLPKTLRLIRSKAEKGELQLVTCCMVTIEFSREISYWDDHCYYENPKFDDYWVKFNGRKNREKYGNFLWKVAWFSKRLAEKEEGVGSTGSWVRYLTCGENKCAIIGPRMHFLLIHEPDKIPTTMESVLGELKCAVEECAKYCGGTVEFSYTDQIRIPFPEAIYRTLTLGKKK